MQISWIAGNKVDWARNEIHINGDVVSIEPKMCAVLKVLVDADGEIVSQQQLLDSVWGNTIVANNTLQRCIAQLRKIFGDSARQQSIIRTHPKLGYSIVVAAISDPTPSNHQTKTIDVNRNFKGLFLSLVLFLSIFTLIFTSNFHNKTNTAEMSFSKSTPITIEQNSISSVSASNDRKKLAYTVKDNDGSWSIIIREFSNDREIYFPLTAQPIGKLSFSSNSTLLYSRLKITPTNKCSDLVELNLKTKVERVLLSCTRYFNHSPNTFDNSHILYEQADKQGNREIRLLNTKTRQSNLLTNAKLNDWSFDRNSRKLAFIHASEAQTDIVQVIIGKDFKLKNKESYSIDGQYHLLTFVPKSELILAGRNHYIAWFDGGRITNRTQYHGVGKIKHLQALSSEELLLVSAQKGQQIVLENADGQLTNIGSNNFVNKLARFRLNSKTISFLSNKSGSFQLWLHEAGEEYRLTSHDANIDSYLWDDNSNLLFLSANQLWKTDLETSPVALNIGITVKKLMQFTSSNTVLALAQSEGKDPKVIEIGLFSKKQKMLYQGDVSWSQKLSNTLLVVDRLGNVFNLNLVTQEIQPFVPYAGFRLQKEPMAIGDAIFLQDKQFNIWRIRENHAPDIVDSYSEVTPFITDYNPQTKTKLAEQFDSEVNQLVLFQF